MSNVKFYRGKKSSIDAHPKEDGSLYFSTDTRKIYMDSGSERIEIAPQAVTDLSNYVTEDDLNSSISAEAIERKNQDSLIKTDLDKKITVNDIIAGQNITLSVDTGSNNVTINAKQPDVTPYMKTTDANNTFAQKVHTHSISQVTDLQDNLDTLQDNIDTKANKAHTHSANDITSGVLSIDRIPDISADKITGIIPEEHLPSYVDAIKEYDSFNDLPLTGETLHIYITKDTNKTYRWSGSQYVEISSSLALGTTSSTAFRGDYGNIAYQHASAKGSAFANGLYKITTNDQGHVTQATAVTKADITALGIPGSVGNNTTYTISKSGSTISLKGSDGSTSTVTDSDTTYEVATSETSGLMSPEMVTKLNSVSSGANSYVHPTYTPHTSGLYKITTDSLGHVSGATAVTKSDITALGIPGTDTNTNTTYTLTKDGSTIALTGSDGSKTTVTDANTTYSIASTSANGLMSSADKAKLDGIASGANAYSLPTASATTLGGIKVGNGLSINNGVLSTNISLAGLGITATSAELNYCDGVTSNIQTQLNGKLSTSGTAAAANKLATARTISLSGDASGSVSFNGSSDVSIPATILHHDATSITSDSNLNSFTDPGWYYCPASATVATLTNCPTTNAFAMMVSQHAGTNQILVEYQTSNPRMWMRNNYLNTWGSWYEIYHTGRKPTPADIDAATSSHTHNYAGSASAGGSANSAVKLDTSAGSATQPIYFSGGKPVACTYTLSKSVPSNAVFTDTNTWIAFKGSTSSAAGTAGYAPAPSAGDSNRYLRCDGTWAVPPDTNTTYTLSSFGITATAAELNYCDGVTSNIQTQLNGKAASNHSHSSASSSDAGFMSAADKSKLDGIAAGANNYSLPTASASTLGGVKVGSGLTISDGILSASTGDTTWYSTKTAGQFYKADDAPNSTNIGKYDGYFYATRVYNAVYIDYAEYYPKAENVDAGHIAYWSEDGAVSSGKPKTCIGIVSDRYGHCLGGTGDGHDDENYVAIAVAGRVPLEIEGKISIGDMVQATNNGKGKKANKFTNPNRIVGKVIGYDPDGRENYMEVLVGGK